MSDDQGWASPGWGTPGGSPDPARPVEGDAPPTPATPGATPPGYGTATGYTPPPGYGQGPSQGWGTPPGWGPPRTPDVKPGIVALRPLALGEILDGAISLIRRHPRVTLGLSAIVATVQALLSLPLTVGVLRNSSPTADLGGDPENPLASFSAMFTPSGIALAILAAVLGLVLTGLLTIVTAEAVLGRSITLPEVLRRARPLLWRLVGAGVLAGLLPYLGLVALLVGGVFLWAALSLTMPALVLERLTVRRALARSWRLVLPDFWRVLGIGLLAWLIANVVSGVLTLPATLAATFLLGDPGSSGTATAVLVTVSALAGIVSTTFTAPFSAGVLALLYLDRRMRAEGLDVTLQRTVAEDAAAGRPGA